MKRIFTFIIGVGMLTACTNREHKFDASGTFEATEVIVSAEVNGKIKQFSIDEGDRVQLGQYIGYIDTTQLVLTKQQLLASQRALKARLPNVDVQVATTQEQITKAKLDKKRIENLLKDGASTQKQLDDIDAQLNVLERTLAAQTSTLGTTVGSIVADIATLDAQIAQVDDQLAKSKIINPIEATVLAKYVEENEMVNVGRPLYKIADTKNMFLRVYLVSTQLESVKLGTAANITINGKDGDKTYSGKVVWISDKAEFTPKTIQTKDERQNLVYATKIAVENTDGLLKIGMYGDVTFAK